MTTCPHCREIQDERAAIHEFDGNATRAQADALAASERCPMHRPVPKPEPEAQPADLL